MILVFYLLVVLGLGHCKDDVPSISEIEGSINRTIDEVERMIRDNPSLPRLTRPQIVDILFNITSKELNSYQDKVKMEKARKLYQRALMVVLPYSVQDSAGSLNDLYTKPPMTQIIPDYSKSSDGVELGEKGKRKDNSSTKTRNSARPTPSVTENLVQSHSNKSIPKSSQSASSKTRYKNHRETYTEIHTKAPIKETLKLDAAPVRFTFNLENLQKNSPTTERTTTTRRPVYRKTTSTDRTQKFEVVYSTSASVESTTKTNSEEIMIDLEMPKEPAVKSSQNILSSDQWRYNAPPSTTARMTTVKNTRQRPKPFLPTTIKIQPEDMVDLATREPEMFAKTPKISVEPARPATVRPTSLYVTPMPTDASSKSKYSASYSSNFKGFRTTTTSTTKRPVRQEVMELLASIGLRPDNRSNVEDVYKLNKELLEAKFQIPDTNNVIYTTASGLTSQGSDGVSIANQNTFEHPGAEIKKGVENLTPDVRLLFQRFGLQPSNVARSTTTERTTTNVNSYTNFKPLPTSSVRDQGMKEFLAKFGLGVERRQKAMKSTKPPSLIEAVPDNMRNVLENIGLISSSRNQQRDMESTETSKYHVFKPHEVYVKDEGQRTKINELLDTVKMVQEGKADIQSVKKVANELLETTKTLKDGPDPLRLEEIIRTYNEGVKNEVKRQQQEQPETTTVPEDTSAMTESTETTSTTASTIADSAKAASGNSDGATTSSPDSSKSATVTSTTASNLLALEESFGGSTQEPDPVLPSRPKNGLYFLVDWNSFLEVGEEDKDKINLRFQPKVGDRTRFLPVTVP